MKLLTKEIFRRLPPLHSSDRENDPIVQVIFFAPWSGQTWYATEFDGVDTFFGLVVKRPEMEWGYFRLKELESLKRPGFRGVPAIERDIWFDPAPISKLKIRGLRKFIGQPGNSQGGSGFGYWYRLKLPVR